MASIEPRSESIKLSLCIATLNRGDLIAGTLDSIVPQLTQECELVVMDCGSTDGTGRIAQEYARRCVHVRYVSQGANNGLDRDFDRVVELARGEYCWLLPDDDLLTPHAVATVLDVLRGDYSLVVANAEIRDITLQKVLWRRAIDIESDHVFGGDELDRLFSTWRDFIMYIGCVVMKRDVWLARDRARWYDSWFIHIGVIFQERLPGRALIMSTPIVVYRYGGSSWRPRWFQIMMFNWPTLVWSMALSEATKKKFAAIEPWRSFRRLLLARAFGRYSLAEYRKYIRPNIRSFREALAPGAAFLVPGVIANAIFVGLNRLSKDRHRHLTLVTLRDSRFHFRQWLLPWLSRRARSDQGSA
jgi:glycosyltransferase involved in cell wall biosynthesis